MFKNVVCLIVEEVVGGISVLGFIYSSQAMPKCWVVLPVWGLCIFYWINFYVRPYLPRTVWYKLHEVSGGLWRQQDYGDFCTNISSSGD